MKPRFRIVLALAAVAAVGAAGAVYAVPELRWRAQVLLMNATGEIRDVSFAELLDMMRPGSSNYLESLARTGNPYGAIHNPYDDPGHAADGAAIFAARCATCHGGEGVGSAAPAIGVTGSLRRGDSDWAIYRAIRSGVPGTAMTPQGLTTVETWSVVAYLRELQSTEARAAAAVQAPPVRTVTTERLLAGRAEPENWLSYSGDYDGARYSPLDEIDRGNAARVQVKWIHQFSGIERIIETTPIVNDGVMYVTEPPATVHALDAATGQPYWTYAWPAAPDVGGCCGFVSRGVAVHGDTVYLAAVDAHLVALDAATGRERWHVQLADYRTGLSVTGAPLVVGDKLIVGYGGGDVGVRGFIDAVSLKDGSRLWRFYTIPGPGEPGHETWGGGDAWKTGGAATWLTGVYDPGLDLLYWGVGNPGPDYQGDVRPGDNLYSNSVIALDPDTGKLAWHFQFTPNDTHDWDANQVPTLAELEIGGRKRKVMLWPNRNAFFYVLDRETGEFLLAAPFARQNWAKGIDPKGRPIVVPELVTSVAGKATWPSPMGAMNWQSAAYSPRTGLMYVPALEWGQIVYRDAKPAEHTPMRNFLGGGHRPIPGAESLYFAVRAIDPRTGAIAWSHDHPKRLNWWKAGGLVATAGDIVFGGDYRELYILDATDGRKLWRMNAGGRINASPIAYAAGGRQFFAMAAGRSIVVVGLP